MTTKEHLLSCLAEECAEVAQRVSKALRFGLDDVEPGQDKNNQERLQHELVDLMAVIGIVASAGMINDDLSHMEQIDRKVAKVEKFLAYAREKGTVID